jgi:tetratricopeptide (TPR) repeat protein
MKQFLTNKRLVSALLLIATALSVFAAFPASAQTETAFSADFGDPNSSYNASLSPSELISSIFGSVDELERAYVDTYFEDVLIYDAQPPVQNVSVKVEGDIVLVRASVKSYTANNGASVSWVPTSATYGDESRPLAESGGEYACTFELGESERVSVNYSATVSLDANYVDSVANMAWHDAQNAEQILSEHSSALGAYLDACESYRQYLRELDEYNNHLALYEEYLEQKKIYDRKLSEYNAYLAALAKYNADLAAFEKYESDYKKYVEDKKKYDEDYKKYAAEYSDYVAYIANLSKIRTSMAAMESIFVTPSNEMGRLYNALLNAEIIAMIEEYQDLICMLFPIEKETVRNLRRVSDELTAIIVEYGEKREISEQEAFEFYKKNYADICYKFNFLYDNMTQILHQKLFIYVCTLFEQKYGAEMAVYKKKRIRNVLCHIYLVCHVLDDKATLGTGWTFYQDNGEKYTYDFSDLLGQNVILTDTNSADPSSLEWISCDTPDVLPPTAPVMPQEVKQPTAPREIKQPTAPTAVSDPGKAPAPVQPPAQRPQIDNYELVLRVEEYLSEAQLSRRQIPDSPQITLTQTATRAFSRDGAPTVAYYNYDGELLSVNALPPTPERASTAEHSFEFERWESVSDGEDTICFAAYTAHRRTYTVTFKASADSDEALYTYECAYGETASFEGELPTKPSTNTQTFQFTGWFPSPAPVKGDALYVAQFAESERLYEVSWSIMGKTQTSQYPFGAEPVIPTVRAKQYIDGDLYEFEGWDKDVTSVTEARSYTARFKVTPLVRLDDGSVQGIELYHDGESYVLGCANAKVDISGLLEKAAQDGSSIVIAPLAAARSSSQDVRFRIDERAVVSLKNQKARYFTVLGSLSDGIGFRFEKASGESTVFVGEVRIIAQNTLGTAQNLYVTFITPTGATGNLNCSADDSAAEFAAQPEYLYKINRYYSISINTPTGGSVFINSTLLKAGEQVCVEALPNSGFVITKMYYTDPQGNQISIDKSGNFAMPEHDVSITVEFSE